MIKCSAMKKTVKSNVRKSSRKPTNTIKIWQVVLGILVIAIIGILIVYRSFAGSDYVLKKSYKNTDSAVLQTTGLSQITIDTEAKKTTAIRLGVSSGKSASTNNQAANYKFTLPVGEYRLCQQGKVLSESAILEVGLIANGADVTAGTYKQILRKNQTSTELVCVNFNIPLDLPANAGEVEYIVKVASDPANPGSSEEVLLTKFNIYVKNDINVSTGVRNNELHKGDKCKGDRIIGGKITDEQGKAVPAQIGVDFHYPDGYSGAIEKNTTTGYERLVYLNITDPQEKNTYWCASIPRGVSKVSIESYSRTVYDHSGKLVNNALLFGDSQDHGIDIAGLYSKTINLVLPNACGSPGVPASIANTGRIIVKEVNVNGEPIDLSPKPDPKQNNLWRAIAWSRNLDPGETIAGYNALNTLQPHTPRADIIDRLAPNQKYLTKLHVTRKNHDYKFEIPGVHVSGCKDTNISVDITDKIYGDYDSKLTCVAKVKESGKSEDIIDCSSVVEERAKSLSL